LRRPSCSEDEVFITPWRQSNLGSAQGAPGDRQGGDGASPSRKVSAKLITYGVVTLIAVRHDEP
jgi:hypothetical protein